MYPSWCKVSWWLFFIFIFYVLRTLTTQEITTNHCGWRLQPWNTKTLAPWKESYDKDKECLKKQRLLCPKKCPYSQSDGFSSSHVCMWELDYKDSWPLKNWRFQTVVLEKTLESHWDSKEIKPVNTKGDQPWIFFGRTGAEAEAPNPLATWWEEPICWKRPWCWER